MKRRAEAGVEVLPLIIRETAGWKKYEVEFDDQFEGVALGKLNALPSSGKPIHDWKPTDKGWASNADGIERGRSQQKANTQAIKKLVSGYVR